MAKLPQNSPLLKSNDPKGDWDAIKALSRKERRWARLIIGKPDTKHRANHIPHYLIRAKMFRRLLKRKHGVPTWNNILSAYKQFAGQYDFRINPRSNTVLISELDLDRIDLSQVELHSIGFVRCSLRNANFENVAVNSSGRYFMMDCCDLDGVEAKGISCVGTARMRTKIGAALEDVNAETLTRLFLPNLPFPEQDDENGEENEEEDAPKEPVEMKPEKLDF